MSTDPQRWRSAAACLGYPTSWFYPQRGDTAAGAVALSICRACSVREACLEDALATEVGAEVRHRRRHDSARQRIVLARDHRRAAGDGGGASTKGGGRRGGKEVSAAPEAASRRTSPRAGLHAGPSRRSAGGLSTGRPAARRYGRGTPRRARRQPRAVHFPGAVLAQLAQAGTYRDRARHRSASPSWRGDRTPGVRGGWPSSSSR